MRGGGGAGPRRFVSASRRFGVGRPLPPTRTVSAGPAVGAPADADSLDADSLDADSLDADSLDADSLDADSLDADWWADADRAGGDSLDRDRRNLTDPAYGR